MWDELQLKHDIHTRLLMLYHALQQLGISHKVISINAYEWNELLQVVYINCIAKEAPDAYMLMFVNEAAKDEHMVSQRYGRSGKGVCCVVQRQFICGMWYSIVPVIMLDGIIVYDIMNGSINREHISSNSSRACHISIFFYHAIGC